MHNIPSTGDVIGGKYRILLLLGQGGMGAVFEAEHEVTKKRVAVKWMNPPIVADGDAKVRLIREAQASARVRHPNIVDVYDVANEGNAIFLVMELLEGETLAALMRRGGTPIHLFIQLLLPALRGVAAAHRQGIIHRDLKPDNIFLARQPDGGLPVPKVLDFGISKVSDGSALTLTRTGAAMGTPMYMSLEQLCGDKEIDARTDVYALGVILYEAVTGRAPFEAETFSELAIKVATVEPPGPKVVRPELPTALADLIGAAMAKRRENRLSSVEELVRRLEPFANEQSFRGKMTRPNQAIPAVRGESEPPPPAPSADAGQVDRNSVIALAPVRSVEANPTARPPAKSGAFASPTLRMAAIAAVVLVIGGAIAIALRGSSAAGAVQAGVDATQAPPAALPSSTTSSRQNAGVAAPHHGASAGNQQDTPRSGSVVSTSERSTVTTVVEPPIADAGVAPPSTAPLAPKAVHRSGNLPREGASPSAPRNADGTEQMHVRDPRSNRSHPANRAGPARLVDF